MTDRLLQMYRQMLAIRLFEKRVNDLSTRSPRTFCTFSREFSSFRRHGIAAGQRP